MILVTVKMNALPAKRREFLQTPQALTSSIRRVKGCKNCLSCQDVENENSFCMIQGWENKRALNKYLQSDLFNVLLGTKNLMSEPWKISFNTVSSSAGIEVLTNTLGTTSEF